MSISLESIMKIDEVGGIFQVQFDLDLAWFDSRLKFKESLHSWNFLTNCFLQNLKQKTSLNNFLMSENLMIWAPELIFINTVCNVIFTSGY